MIDDGYTDFFGEYRAASTETKEAILRALGAPDAAVRRRRLEPVYVFSAGLCARGAGIAAEELRAGAWSLYDEAGTTRALEDALEPGYYRLAGGDESSALIAVPPRAYVPPELDEHPQWGLAVQLYALRSATNWGIGDFGDLASLLRIVREAGGAAVALNPLHALHLTNPTSASPYSPLSRLYVNPLYVDVPAAARSLGVAPDAAGTDAQALHRLRDPALVDYAGVTDLKVRALRNLHAHAGGNAAAAARFHAFKEAGGERLRRLATYQALMDRFKRENPETYGWMQWPEEYRDPESPAVASFAAANPTEVEFYQFVQWLADEQLAGAAEAAAGMPIGIYRDLAVGVDAGSADVWMDREAFCLGISVGAPPDPMNESGQNWGLPPLNPRVLRERAYAPFIQLLRANMRHAGALRIDHVMGLMRLFCIPAGMPSRDGTYVHYPFEEMLGVLALESVRNRCTIVGEDLGTVPPGFRERMARARVFSCRLLYFENETEQYPRDAVASIGTHDLPPLRRYWANADSAVRGRLLDILESRGDVPRHTGEQLLNSAGEADDDTFLAFVSATYRLLGRSNALLLLAQLEDVLLQREQINTPGTFDEVPNWRHKVPVDLEDLADDRRFKAAIAALREVRPPER